MEDLQKQLAELMAQNADLQRRLAEQQPRPDPPPPPVVDLPDPGQPAARVNHIAVKLPPFWPDKPALWFAQVEAQFVLASITRESTKFNHVVSQLDGRYASEVEDVIIAPPVDEPYTHLKKELIKRLGKSQEQRVRQLMMAEELGDRKPSQFLRHLRSLAGPTSIEDSLMRALWIQRLPATVQAILQTQASLSLDQTAEIADKIMEVASPSPGPSVFAAAAPPVDLASLAKRLDDLSQQVAALSTRQVRPRSRSTSRSSSPSREPKDGDICWYHERYGKDAQRCRPPCRFAGNARDSA